MITNEAIKSTDYKNIKELKADKVLFLWLSTKFADIKPIVSYNIIKSDNDPLTYIKKCGYCFSAMNINSDKTYCCYSCAMKSRYTDPSYTDRVSKARNLTFASTDPSILSERSRKGYQVRVEKHGAEFVKEQFISGIRNANLRKKNDKIFRINSIITRYGLVRGVMKLYQISGRSGKHLHSLWLFVEELKDTCDINLPDILKLELVTKFRDKYMTEMNTCMTCNVEFRKYDIVNLNEITSNSHKYCSKECILESYRTEERRNKCSERTKIFWENPEYKEKQRIALKERHDNSTKEQKQQQSDRRSTTLDKSDPEWRINWNTKLLQTKYDNGYISHIRTNTEDRKDYLKYKNMVYNYTRKNVDLTTIENYEFRGKHSFHLDHVFPISIGYILNIPVEFIGKIENLQFIPAEINRKKSNKLNFFEIPVVINNYINEHGDERTKQLYEDIKNRTI